MALLIDCSAGGLAYYCCRPGADQRYNWLELCVLVKAAGIDRLKQYEIKIKQDESKSENSHINLLGQTGTHIWMACGRQSRRSRPQTARDGRAGRRWRCVDQICGTDSCIGLQRPQHPLPAAVLWDTLQSASGGPSAMPPHCLCCRHLSPGNESPLICQI